MKQFILIFALALTASISMQAQPIMKATYATYLRTAEEQLELNQFYNALDNYILAYNERKDYDLAIKIADLSYKLRDYKKAASYYKRSLRKDEKDKKGAYTEYYFPYGRSQKMLGMYDEAIVTLQKYIDNGADETLKELAKAEIQGAEYAKLAQPVENLTITNAGKKVNTKTSEYSPTLADGGNTMYYTGFGTSELIVLDGKAERTNAIVMSSKRGEKGWEEPTELDEIINREGYHTSNVYVTPDGNSMYLSRMLLDGAKITESKIYVSEKGSDGWGPVKELVGVNGDYNAKHGVPGELFGKEVIFFVSDMEGGEGGDDIYYATRKSGEVYGDPVNLGPKINTPGDEATPFYRESSLESKIYFSSNGHPTMGGFDIFSAVWDGTRWSTPENMGMGYNTPLDEKYFTLDAEGYQGTMTSNREGTRSLKSKTCCDDIYYVNLKKILADLVVTAFDTKDREPLTGVSLQLIEMLDNTEGVTQTQTNADGNEFKFDLDLDKPYRIIAKAENFEPDTVEFNTVGMIDSRTFEEMVNLKPLPKYETIVTEQPIELGNVLYDFGKADIRPDAEPDLTFLLNLMNEYPTMIIELSSHTDSRGSDANNRTLAQRRAESARRWLMNKGIARRRIQAVGYGESQPRKVSDKISGAYTFLPEGVVLTEEYINAMPGGEEVQELAHQLNRRTEFKIISGPTSIRIEETKLLQIGNKKVQEQTKTAPDKGANVTSATQNDPPTISNKSSLYGRKDLKGVPIMTFKTRMIELGKVKKGEKRTGTFYFTNEGDTELYIDLVDACTCTTVEWPEGKTFQPGEGGQIDFTFDSTEKEESETIDLNILLRQETPGDEMPIVEEVNYSFDLVK